MHTASDRRFVYPCLVVFALLSYASAWRESPTFDEPTHLISGYLYWRTGHYVANPADPPLLPLWSAIPLLALHLPNPLPIPRQVIQSGLSLAAYYLYHNILHPDILLNSARGMIVLLGLSLGYLIWRWSSEILGKRAGRVSLLAFIFCPPLLAFSHLVTPDFALALGGFASLYAFWHQRRTQSVTSSLIFGFLFGVTLMIKFSGLLMLPIFMAIAAVEWNTGEAKSQGESPEIQMSMGFVGVLLPIILSYRKPGLLELFHELQFLNALLAHPTPHYFLGHVHPSSWIWFPSACLLLKTPLPFLFLASVGLAWAFRGRSPGARTLFVWGALPATLYWVMLSFVHHFIGIRRILLVYPLLCMLIGGAYTTLEKKSARTRYLCFGLGLWYAASSIALFPRYLSYFNELAGGPSRGYRFLLHCNSDWGQGLKALGIYLHEQQARSIYLSYFGSATPQLYGIHFVSVGPVTDLNVLLADEPGLDPRREAKVLFAISTNNAAGLYFPDPTLFSWLKTRTPTTIVMDSILVYDVTRDPEALSHLETLRTSRRPS